MSDSKVTHIVIGYVNGQGWTAAAYQPSLDVVKGILELRLVYAVSESWEKSLENLLKMMKEQGYYL